METRPTVGEARWCTRWLEPIASSSAPCTATPTTWPPEPKSPTETVSARITSPPTTMHYLHRPPSHYIDPLAPSRVKADFEDSVARTGSTQSIADRRPWKASG